MTEAQAKRAGYKITRGDYHGTNDDRFDGWYIHRIGEATLDRRGSGFATKREALATLGQRLEILQEG